MTKKLLKLLEDNDIEVTDDLKSNIENIWDEATDTGDLFTQDDVDDIIKKRLAREKSAYETEIKELKEAMKDLVDPEKVEEYEQRIEELEGKADKVKAELVKDYELKLAATEAGVTDQEYFEFLVEKKGLKDRIKTDDDGNIYVTNDAGDAITDEDGNRLGTSKLLDELKEDKPDLFNDEGSQKKKSTGSTNPAGGGESEVAKKEAAADLAANMGYANKDKE